MSADSEERSELVNDCLYPCSDLSHSGFHGWAIDETDESLRSYLHVHVWISFSGRVDVDPKELCVRLELARPNGLNVLHHAVGFSDHLVIGPRGDRSHEADFTVFVAVGEADQSSKRMVIDLGDSPLVRLIMLDDAQERGIDPREVSITGAPERLPRCLRGLPFGDHREIDAPRLAIAKGLGLRADVDQLPGDVIERTAEIVDGVSGDERPITRHLGSVGEGEDKLPLLRLVRQLDKRWQVALVADPLPGLRLKLGKMMLGTTEFLKTIYESGQEVTLRRATVEAYAAAPPMSAPGRDRGSQLGQKPRRL